MNQQQMDYLKKKLLNEKNDLLHEMKDNNSFGLDENMNDSLGELSGYDNHPADIGTELFEREKDIALRENQMHIFEQINMALERIDNGTYGKCAKCHKEIPLERLEVVPYANYCIEHQPNDNVSESRPVEEEFLSPPFGRTSFDDKDNETEFDAEDSWQSVARYGTSNTPSDFLDNIDDYNDTYIESDEPIGYVDALEGFIVTDMEGNPSTDKVDVVENKIYDDYFNDDKA